MPIEARPESRAGLFAQAKARLAKKMSDRRFVRYSLLALNILVLGGVVLFVLRAAPADINSYHNVATATTADAPANPLDQLSSADIAANLATMTNLPEANAVANQAETVNAELAVPAQTTVVDKPQVVATALKSREDIKTYIAKSGDTIASIAAAFGVTSDSISWSNGLTGTGVAVGTKLLIPPVNGIVYTVKSGDTIASLAQKYNADQNKLIAYNDAEISGIQPGEQILIPDAQEPAAQTAARTLGIFGGGSATYATSGSGCSYQGHSYPMYGYDCGYCTWWVAMRRAAAGDPVPSNLGNASSWGYLARAYGLSVGSTPQVGAAVVTSTSGAGHVAYVIGVNGDGTITISEMNHEGWNITDTRTIPAAGYTYIY